MNLRCLKTIIAVSEHPTFFAAGNALGLSHSAVSLHIKMLEDELQVPLVDRTRRPPVLTERGLALVERAQRVMDLLDEIAVLGSDERLIGSLKVGVVLTAMVDLLPPALAALSKAHPDLLIDVRAGLSDDLAQHVLHREIDVAVATQPAMAIAGLQSRVIADEPLFVIAPANVPETDDTALLSAHPFIWFNRKSWAGQQIEQHLQRRGILVRNTMEVELAGSHRSAGAQRPRRVGRTAARRSAGSCRRPPGGALRCAAGDAHTRHDRAVRQSEIQIDGRAPGSASHGRRAFGGRKCAPRMLSRPERRIRAFPDGGYAAVLSWKPGVDCEMRISSSVMSAGMSPNSGVLR